ncbi:MAG: DUF3592 domain-containing protein [Candidatus Hodarchaeales archaeon]
MTIKDILLIISFLSFLLAFSMIIVILKIKIQRNWPTTEGIIESSYIESHFYSVNEQKVFYARLTISYSINGMNYQTEKKCGKNTTSEAQLISQYPRGGKIILNYNPKNPEKTVYEPKMGIPVVIALLSLIPGIFVFLSLSML